MDIGANKACGEPVEHGGVSTILSSDVGEWRTGRSGLSNEPKFEIVDRSRDDMQHTSVKRRYDSMEYGISIKDTSDGWDEDETCVKSVANDDPTISCLVSDVALPSLSGLDQSLATERNLQTPYKPLLPAKDRSGHLIYLVEELTPCSLRGVQANSTIDELHLPSLNSLDQSLATERNLQPPNKPLPAKDRSGPLISLVDELTPCSLSDVQANSTINESRVGCHVESPPRQQQITSTRKNICCPNWAAMKFFLMSALIILVVIVTSTLLLKLYVGHSEPPAPVTTTTDVLQVDTLHSTITSTSHQTDETISMPHEDGHKSPMIPEARAAKLANGIIVAAVIIIVVDRIVGALPFRLWKRQREHITGGLTERTEYGHVSVLQREVNNPSTTPLHIAATNGDHDEVVRLCKESADIEAIDSMGRTPLGASARNGHVRVVEYLLAQGADVNSPGSNGYPPLSGAALKGHAKLVELLCKNGADLNLVDKNGETGLHYPTINGFVNVINILLEYGADLTIVNRHGETALGTASGNGHLEAVPCLVDKGADVDSPGSIGMPPLHCAAREGHRHVVRYLLDKGAFIEAVCYKDQTPLGAAAEKGETRTMEELLKRGANVNGPETNGQPPLHSAAVDGHHDALRLLVDKGADVHLKNKAGLTAATIAARGGHVKLVELLIDKGANMPPPIIP